MKAKKIIICILTATVFLAGTVQALDYDERRILFGENYAQIEKIPEWCITEYYRFENEKLTMIKQVKPNLEQQ